MSGPGLGLMLIRAKLGGRTGRGRTGRRGRTTGRDGGGGFGPQTRGRPDGRARVHPSWLDAARMPPDPHPPDIVNAGQRSPVGHNLPPHSRPLQVPVHSENYLGGTYRVGPWLYGQ